MRQTLRRPHAHRLVRRRAHAAPVLIGLVSAVYVIAFMQSAPPAAQPTSSASPLPEPVLPLDDLQAGLRPTPLPTPPATQAPTPTPTKPAVVKSTPKPPAATPKPKPKPKPHGPRLTGVATYYDYHRGQAAAGPLLRRFLGPNWRGDKVTVCSGARCLVVRLTDWCACKVTGQRRLIDLDRRDWSYLGRGHLGMGLLKVSVSRGG